jgi:hypothetical protein
LSDGCFHPQADLVRATREQLHERFVNRIVFDLGGELTQHVHDAREHVPVEGIVRREYRDAMFPDDRLGLEVGDSHLDTERLGFRGSCDNAAVIVGQDDHGLATQVGPEDRFAGGIEGVAVDKGDHRDCLGE